MSRPAELRQLNDDELAQRLTDAKEEMFHLRFQLAMGKQDNSARLIQVRRDVARVLTLQTERRAGTPRPVAARAAKSRKAAR